MPTSANAVTVPSFTSVALVEDDQPLREVIEGLLRAVDTVALKAVFGSVAEMRAALADGLVVDVAVLDLGLPDGDGWELIDDFQATGAASRVVILSGRQDEYTLERARDPFVFGFIDKLSISVDALRFALERIVCGERYFSPSIIAAMKAFRRNPDAWVHTLSQRERELLLHFATGVSDNIIADKVGLQPATVHAHRKSVMKKLGVHSTVELVLWAFNRGVARPVPPRRSPPGVRGPGMGL